MGTTQSRSISDEVRRRQQQIRLRRWNPQDQARQLKQLHPQLFRTRQSMRLRDKVNELILTRNDLVGEKRACLLKAKQCYAMRLTDPYAKAQQRQRCIQLANSCAAYDKEIKRLEAKIRNMKERYYDEKRISSQIREGERLMKQAGKYLI